MEFKILIAAAIILAFIIAGAIMSYSSFENWLVFAVSAAEKQFGGKTGKLKLRYVYNMAVEVFPVLVKLMPFSLFSVMVDSALEIMKDMADKNKTISNAITKSDCE